MNGFWKEIGQPIVVAVIVTLAIVSVISLCMMIPMPHAIAQTVTSPTILTAPGYLKSVGYHKYTVSNAAKDLTDASSYTVPTDAHYIVIAVEDAPIRWLDEGTTPESAVGMPLAVGSYYFLPLANRSAFKMIRSTGTDATVYILFRAK